MPLIDNVDLEALAETAARLNRWEFMFVVASLPVYNGAGSAVNPVAIFYSISSNLHFRLEYRPGSELFVVYSEDQDTNPFLPDRSVELPNRGFVVKVTRLFRF